MKGMKVEDNYLDLTLMELLETDVLINLPSLILKYMQRVLTQDKIGMHYPIAFVSLIFFRPILFQFKFGPCRLQRMF